MTALETLLVAGLFVCVSHSTNDYVHCLNGGTLTLQGFCKCPEQFEGDRCEIDKNKCIHGEKIAPTVCLCGTAWKGKLCDTIVCYFGVNVNKTHCKCDDGYLPPDCKRYDSSRDIVSKAPTEAGTSSALTIALLVVLCTFTAVSLFLVRKQLKQFCLAPFNSDAEIELDGNADHTTVVMPSDTRHSANGSVETVDDLPPSYDEVVSDRNGPV